MRLPSGLLTMEIIIYSIKGPKYGLTNSLIVKQILSYYEFI